MGTESWVRVFGVLLALTGIGIGWFIGDFAFPIRAVQSGSHETVFILLALIIGLTLKNGNDEASISALVFAIAMAIVGFLMNGLDDLDSPRVQLVGYGLYGLFAGALMGTLIYLLRALKHRSEA